LDAHREQGRMLAREAPEDVDRVMGEVDAPRLAIFSRELAPSDRLLPFVEHCETATAVHAST
jgi:hypothetical protein